MRTVSLCAAVATVLMTGEPATASSPGLEQVWALDGFDNPESVVATPDGVLLVSNVGGEGDARDGNGFISRISTDGRMLERNWATGLNGPKGLALSGDRLFVTDIDRVVEIDVATGRVMAERPVPGAVFLNDAAPMADGSVLVTDSGGGRIHRIHDGAVETWLEDPRLRSINGLLVEADRVLVTTMQGLLLAVALNGRAVTVLAEGLGDADGVAPAPGGSYIVSEWRGRLFHVDAAGTVSVMADTREARVFQNDFIHLGDLLIVPNWVPGRVTAHRLTESPR